MVPIRSCRQISTSSARTLTSITDERANDLDSGNASPPQMSSTSPRIAPNPTADFPEDGYAPLSAAARRAPSAEMRPNKRAAFRDRAAAGGKRRMEQVPDMDHLGPDLEADADIRGPGGPGEAQRVVEQGLGGPDLDEERREAPEVGIDRRRQRRTRGRAAEIELGHFDEPRLVDDRVVRGLARHRRSDPFHVYPWRDTPSAGGLRQPGVAHRQHRGDDEPAAGAVAGERHPLRRKPLRQQKPVAGER